MTSQSQPAPTSLSELEHLLRDSHSTDALTLIQTFATSLTGPRRQELFNKPGTLIRPPIEHAAALRKGYWKTSADDFVCLQGDVVETSAAFFMGMQVTSGRYVIASSTCDLVPGRRDYALLFRVYPLSENNDRDKNIYGNVLKFKSNKLMFLPPLSSDKGKDVIGNVINLDGIATISSGNLRVATRLASMSLIGWRIFGCFTRGIVARAGEEEVDMRANFERVLV